MTKAKLKVISTEKEHRLALNAIEDLWAAVPGSEDHDSLEVLSLLVEDYEKAYLPDGAADSRQAEARESSQGLMPVHRPKLNSSPALMHHAVAGI